MPSELTDSASPDADLFLHQRITRELRHSILSGELPPGTRLPSMEELARSWGTSYFTIRQAMKPLAQEGLVEHRRRHGTIVKGTQPTVSQIGLYYGADILGMAETNFYRSLHAKLRERLARRRIGLVPFIDERPEADQATPLPRLQKAVDARTIQAVIVPLSSRIEAQWLSRLPLPKAFISSTDHPWAVRPDHRQQLRLALRQIRKRGARSTGVIVNLPRDFDAATGDHPPLLRCFLEEAERAGVETSPDWCAFPPHILSPSEMESYGYSAFLNLWQHSSRQPDALLSTSDVIGRGALMAVLKLGLEVPDQLRVVQWVNAGTGFFTPLGIDRIVLDEGHVAKALIGQLDHQTAGTPIAPVSIPSVLSANSFSLFQSLV